MQISYQISEKQDVIRVRRKDMISQIKEKIAQKEKINSKQFYLTDVSNKRLDDNITVGGAGIQVNGHLYCEYTSDCQLAIELSRITVPDLVSNLLLGKTLS